MLDCFIINVINAQFENNTPVSYGNEPWDAAGLLLRRTCLGLQLRHCSSPAPEHWRQLLWQLLHWPSSSVNVCREQPLKNSQCPFTSFLVLSLQVRQEDGWGPEHVWQVLSHSKTDIFGVNKQVWYDYNDSTIGWLLLICKAAFAWLKKQ